MHIRITQLAMLLAGLSVSYLAAAEAGVSSFDEIFDSVSIYAGQGVNHNLRELPGTIFSGYVDRDKTYFTALGFSKFCKTIGQSFKSLQATPLSSIKQGYEMVLAQHHGLQSDTELGAAYTLRTHDMQMGTLGINFMAGAGLSYAFGTPSYEDGSEANPAKRYRLQYMGLFEFEWRVSTIDNLSVVTGVHHRSGIYGLIAPRQVGSNFLAVGVRYKF